MEIKTELVFEFKANGATPIYDLGAGPLGRRRMVAMEGEATFEGPRLKGTLVPGGADWQLVRADGVTEIMAMYILKTHDGVLLQVSNRGIRHGPPEVMQRLAQGETVDPALYYFRSTPTIEAPTGDYDWLNKNIYICTGARYPNGIHLWVYRVL